MVETVQERLLVRFWQLFRNGADRIALLRYYAQLRFRRRSIASRSAFEQSGIRHRRKCAVCRDKANHRHHIIQLCHGGLNLRANIISLCRYCHRTVHAPQGTAVKPKSRFNETPRLVKKARVPLESAESSSLQDGECLISHSGPELVPVPN